MANWFIIRDGKEQGPLTTDQLKQLAASGQIQPDTPIRREDKKAAVPASKINGLLPVEVIEAELIPDPSPPSPPRPSPPRAASGKPNPLITVGVLALSVILMCGTCVHISNIRGAKALAATEERLAAATYDEVVEATVLYSQFSGNAVAAEARYSGKRIIVEGEVVSVDKGIFGGTIIYLAKREGVNGVQCSLSNSAAKSDALMKVRPGSWLRVEGVCKGQLFDSVGVEDSHFVIVNE